METADQLVPFFRLELLARVEFLDAVFLAAHARAEVLGRHLGIGAAQHRKIIRQQTVAGQVVQRRHQQTLGQVTGRTEDHHDAGFTDRRGALCILPD